MVVKNNTSEKFRTLSAFPEPIPRKTAKGFTPINQNPKFATITKKKKLSNKIKLIIKIRTFSPLASGYTGLQPILTEVIPASVIVCWGNFKRVSVMTTPFSSNMIFSLLTTKMPINYVTTCSVLTNLHPSGTENPTPSTHTKSIFKNNLNHSSAGKITIKHYKRTSDYPLNPKRSQLCAF